LPPVTPAGSYRHRKLLEAQGKKAKGIPKEPTAPMSEATINKALNQAIWEYYSTKKGIQKARPWKAENKDGGLEGKKKK